VVSLIIGFWRRKLS